MGGSQGHMSHREGQQYTVSYKHKPGATEDVHLDTGCADMWHYKYLQLLFSVFKSCDFRFEL